MDGLDTSSLRPAGQGVQSAAPPPANGFDVSTLRPAGTPIPPAPKEDLAGQFGAGLVTGIPHLAEFAGNVATNPLGVQELGRADDNPAEAMRFQNYMVQKYGAPDTTKFPNGWSDDTRHKAWQEFVAAGQVVPRETQKPEGGGDLLAKGLTAIHANPDEYFAAPKTPGERIARMAGEGAVTMAVPGAAELNAPRALADLGVGAISGAAGQGAAELAPEEYKPLASVVGSLVGGVGGVGAVEGTKFAGAQAAKAWTGMPEKIAGIPTGSKTLAERAAANYVQKAAADPEALRSSLDTMQESPVPGFKPNLYQATDDPGIGVLSGVIDRAYPEAWVARRDAQAQAWHDALAGAQPEGQPTAVADVIRQQQADLDALTAAQEQRAQAQVTAALGDHPAPEVAAEKTRAAMQSVSDARDQRISDLYKAIDPQGTMMVVSDPLKAAYKSVYGDITPEMKSSLTPFESELATLVNGYGPALPLKNLMDLKSRISTEMRTANSPLTPNSVAAGRLTQMRGAVETAIDDTVAGKAASEQAAVDAGKMSPEDTLYARLVKDQEDWLNARKSQGNAAVANNGEGARPNAGIGSTAVPRASGAESATAQPSGLSGAPRSPDIPPGTRSAEQAPVTTSIADTMAQRFADAGRSAEEAKAAGSVFDAFYRSTAERLGVPVEKLMEDHPLPQVQRGADEGQFQQAAPPQSPEFRNWFGNSKVVDAEGKPLVVYHGTADANFDTFRPGSFFTASADEAGAYTFWRSMMKREAALAKRPYVEGTGVDLAGKRVPYSGIISDAREQFDADPKQGNVWATDEAVVRFRPDGKVEFLTDVVPVYDKSGGDTIALKKGDARKAYRDRLQGQREGIDSRYADAATVKSGAVYPVYLSIKNPKMMDFLAANRLGKRLGATDEGIASEISKLKAQGFDGIETISDEGAIHPELFNGEPPRQFIPFDPTQIKSVNNRGTFDPTDPRILFQPDFKQGKRGSIRFEPSGSVITMFKAADASTAMHEAGHHFLQMFKSMAEGPDAPKTLANDWRAAKAWWDKNANDIAGESGKGVSANDVRKVLREGTSGDKAKDLAIDRGLHEQWARGFESYLRDGKAPNSALRGVFEQFKYWLTKVYAHAQQLGVKMSPEIKSVFDRMLRTAQPSRPGMADAATANRLRQATSETKELRTQQRQQPVGSILQREGASYPYKMSPGTAATAMWAAGPRGADAVRNIATLAKNHPDVIEGLTNLAGDSLLASTAAKGLTPESLAAWRSKYAPALAELDRIAPGTGAKFDSVASATDALAAAKKIREETTTAYEKSVLGKFIGARDEAEVTRRVDTVLGSTTAAKDMRALVSEVKGNPDAITGLRKSVMDAIASRAQSAIATTKSGSPVMSVAQFTRYLRKAEPALREVLTKDQIDVLHGIAETMRQASRTVNIAGQSGTQQFREAAARFKEQSPGERGTFFGSILGRLAARHGAAAVVGGLSYLLSPQLFTAALGAAGVEVFAALRQAGVTRVNELVRAMIEDPEFARDMLSKVPLRPKVGAWVPLLRRLRMLALTTPLKAQSAAQ